jgi:hypothetical protein
MDAEDKYWGAIDSPSEPGGTVSGDPVSENVDFSPFETAVNHNRSTFVKHALFFVFRRLNIPAGAFC